MLLQDEIDQVRERMAPAALICSVIANVNRDPDTKPEPYTAADFMPGAKSDEEEMAEFAERVLRGDTFEVDPEAVEAFRLQMRTNFRNLVTADA